MDVELYDRQTMLDLKPVESATIVGVGGTGSWSALFLAMSGCNHLYLMDGDLTERSNFNRLPIPAEGNIGVQKTELMSKLIASLRPEAEVTRLGRATMFSLVTTEGTIFDCTDSQPVQAMLYKFAKENNRKYIRVGYDGTHITVTDRVPTWKTSGVQREGYEVFPSWVVPAALAACFGVAKAMYEDGIKVIGDLKEFKMKEVS